MAPPTWLGLANATGDDKYAVFADEEFWATHEYLFRPVPDFAPGGGLFLRDSRFFEPGDSGKLVFWGRGNGWVYAGLTSILELLPEDHPSRPRYEELFVQMSIAVLQAQVASGPHAGFWPPSLLEYEEHPFPESSGTGFFVSGLLFGVRSGRLSAAAYLPAAERGWAALVSAQLPDGRIGWTQQIGAEPDVVEEGDTQLYATGAFLKAAAELLKLTCAAGASPAPSRPATTTPPAQQQPRAVTAPPGAAPPTPCGSAFPCPDPVATPAAAPLPAVPPPPPAPPTSVDCSADESPCGRAAAAGAPPAATPPPPATSAARPELDPDAEDAQAAMGTAEDEGAVVADEGGAAEDASSGDDVRDAATSGAGGLRGGRIGVAVLVAAVAAVAAVGAIAAGAGGSDVGDAS